MDRDLQQVNVKLPSRVVRLMKTAAAFRGKTLQDWIEPVVVQAAEVDIADIPQPQQD